MKPESYQLSKYEHHDIFEFTSVGRRGNIRKLIIFRETSRQLSYEFIFGDYDGYSGKIDTKTVSDNGDFKVVMATVVKAVQFFLVSHSDRTVVFRGSTES